MLLFSEVEIWTTCCEILPNSAYADDNQLQWKNRKSETYLFVKTILKLIFCSRNMHSRSRGYKFTTMSVMFPALYFAAER